MTQIVEVTKHKTYKNVDGSGGFWIDEKAGKFADAIAAALGKSVVKGDWSSDVYVDISGQESSKSSYVTVNLTNFDGPGELTYKVRISDHDLPSKYHQQDEGASKIWEIRYGQNVKPQSVAKELIAHFEAAATNESTAQKKE